MSDDPRVFGPPTWKRLHYAAARMYARDFFPYLEREVSQLPCDKCKKHATRYLKDHPVGNFQDLTGAFRYVWLLHNTVNTRLKKPLVSFEDAIRMYV